MSIAVYEIPEANLEKLKLKIEKLGKRAERLMGQRIFLNVIGFKDVDADGTPFKERVYEVFIAGPEPKINGWEFVARIDHGNKEVGNIIRSVPGFEAPEKYRDVGCDCDHCNIHRYRRDTFLVRNLETQEIKQVGTACLKDFLGHGDPERYAKLAELLGYALEYVTAARINEVGYDRRWINIEEYCAWVAFVVRKNHGFMGRTRAREVGGMATADQAFSDMLEFYDAKRSGHVLPSPSEDDDKLALAALEWAQGLGEDGRPMSEYEHNIHVIAQGGVIEQRSIGFTASIVGSYWRNNVLPTLTKVDYKNSQWVGKEKDKVEMQVTVLDAVPLQTGSTRIRFLDSNNNLFVWFASGEFDFEDGERCVIKATIKGHSEYRDVKQTLINRVKKK